MIAILGQKLFFAPLQIQETSEELSEALSTTSRLQSQITEDERKQNEMTNMIHDLRDKLTDQQRHNEQLQQSVSMTIHVMKAVMTS